MKRFFIIFLICFASVIGVIAGVFGIKYLKGDFNEVVVNPENISFEFEEYDVVDDFSVIITTTTEGVTATNVTLSFAKGTVTNTHGADHLTDGVIIIPKQVKLGEAFEIKLFKTIDAEADNKEWIKGGISNIVATSECVTTPKDTASIYVDVPVYKTEIVVLSGEGQVSADTSYVNALTYIEGQTGLIKSAEKSLNAGDTFYVGLKYYPARSAYKYSKASSTNLLVEYQDQILAKLEELGLTAEYSKKFEELSNLFVSEQEKANISINQLFEMYSEIVDFSKASNSTKDGQFMQYLSELKTQFEKNLKYYTYEEATNNEQTYTTKIKRVDGTNVYKVQTTTNSVLLQSGVTANLYAYTFANAKLEADTLSVVGNNYSNLLSTCENLYTEQGLELKNKKVDKATLSFDIVDVDVDTIIINGEIQDFPVNKIHTLYLAKQGEGNQNSSYLNLVLKNSNVDTVDLQNKLFNVGIRFEKRITTNTWNDADEITFVDSQNYTKVNFDGKTYYLPLGSSIGYLNSYWQIYSDTYVSNDVRAVLVYFKGDLSSEILAEQVISATEYPLFKLEDPAQTEQMVKWNNTSPLTLGVVDITGTVDMSVNDDVEAEETLKNVSYNTEIDLLQYIDIPAENYYQTYKIFLYSDDTAAEALAPISNYFYTTEKTSKQYPFYGTTKNLYELDGSILKLKKSEWPSTYTIKIMFATIKTGALRTPILTPIYDADGETILDYRYTFVKYSAVKDNIVENLSYITVNFTGSIKTLSGIVSDALRENSINNELAGVADDGLFKVAQNAQNALIVTVNCQDTDSSLVKSAIDSGNLRLEALTGKTGAENFVTYTSEYISGKNYFIVSTKAGLDEDVNVRLYLVYNVDGEEYLFPVAVDFNSITYHKLTIVKNTSESAQFKFSTNSGVVDINEINYIEVVTSYGKNADGSDDTQTFTKSFYVYYKDGRDADKLENRKIYINDTTTNKVLVEVIDFLGNTTTTVSDWYLTSSNSEVAKITDNQIINFVGKCDISDPLVINLYIANGTLQQSVNFVVNETGYVFKVVEKTDKNTERTIFEYDETALTPTKYTFVKQTISVDEAMGAEVQIDDLLEIFYKLNKEADFAPKLPMLAYIVNEDSLKALKQIASGQTTTGIDIEALSTIPSDDNYFEKHPISKIILKENLGSVVTIDMVYVCAELGLTQAVSAKFNQTIAISDVSITNRATGNKISINNSVYDIYAGLDYDIALTSSSPNLYYYFDGESNKANIQTINDKIFNIKFKDGSTSQQKIHITDEKTFTVDAEGNRIPGRLDYVLEFNVQKNVSLITTNSIDRELEGNTLNIDLLEIFERLTALTGELPENATNPNLKNYPILGDIGFDWQNYAPDNSKISNISLYTDPNFDGKEENRKIVITFGEFKNSIDIKIYVKCNGEILGGVISLHIVPEDLQSNIATAFAYYNGQKAIVVSNGQTVKSTNVNFFNDLFNNGTVVCGDDFYNTYTVTEGTITRVVLSTNTLFENTNSKVTVTKDGISNEYVIIISKLAFPFVQFADLGGNPLSYANLDIYNLFVNTEDILNYYLSNNIASFVPTAIDGETDATLLLVNTEDDSNAVIKLHPNGGQSTIANTVNFNNLLGSIQVLQGSLTANEYAVLSHTSTDSLTGSILLSVNPVGEDVYLKVNVHVLPNGSSTYYEIPVVVKLELTQVLQVTYPFSGYYKDSTDKGYGSEEFDESLMLESSSTFEESHKYMEYLSFEGSIASIDLLDSNYNRFKVYKGEKLDTNYTGGFTFNIENISKNSNGVWSFVEHSELINYAYFENNLLSSSNGVLNISNAFGGTAFRVKIKVTTQGGAVSYYYVSAGEQVPLTLNRQSNNANVSVGKTDSITVSAGNIILIGGGKENDYVYSEVSPTFYYYISNANYNKEIKFRIFDSLGNVISDENIAKYAEIDKNKLTIAVQPMGINFKIQIYTSYGVLTTVSVTVENSVTVNLTSNTIYSGSTYSFDEIIVIKPVAGIKTITIVSVVSEQQNPLFTCENEFKFANIPAGQTQVFDMVLTISIKIDSMVEPFTFVHTFESVNVVPRFIAKSFDNGFYRDETENGITTYTENSGIIEISNDIWENMFNDLKTDAGLDVSQESTQLRFFVEGIDKTEFVKDSTISWSLDYILTDEETRNWTFTIKDLSGQILTSAYAKITVKPQYNVVINYPKVINEVGGNILGLTYEYVQNGGSVDFNVPNFSNSENRITVYNSETNEVYSEYNIEFEGKDGEYASKVDGDKNTGFTFNFATTDFANKTEIECRFNVKINEKIYATYVVKVIKDSPFALQTDYLDTIYYGYGSSNNELFTKVDVYVTLPSLSKFALGDKVDLYIDNGSITRIAEKIYYRAGDKIHGVMSITDYGKDLKVYICKQDGGELGMDDQCTDVEFKVRATLKYNVYDVQYKHYTNILGDATSSKVSEIDYVTTCTVNVAKNNMLSIVSSPNIAQGIYVDYTFDIYISDDYIKQSDALVLYANEVENGQSFVELFNVQDALGNQFWYNQVGGTKNTSLTVRDIDGAMECLPVYPQTILDEYKFDYLLKPLGAKNESKIGDITYEGTFCELTFEYKFDNLTYTKVLYVRVISDIEFQVYNNDGTSTPNSKTNPLKINSTSGNITFVSANQSQYIYAYNKFSSEKVNIAQQMIFNVEKLTDSATDYINIVKLTSPVALQICMIKSASFGNKTIQLVLKDMYGFTINYYIELIADINVTSISTIAGKVYEGDSITVYNKNKNDNGAAGGSNGSVAITLNRGADKDTSTPIIVYEATFWFDGSTYYTNAVINDVEEMINGVGKITFNFLSYEDIWNTSKSNGYSFTGTLHIVIGNGETLTDERYSFDISFTLFKKYSFEILPENTFVREGVEVDLTHFVDVYDYSQESYLGKPILTQNEEIQVMLPLNNGNTDSNGTYNLRATSNQTLYSYINDVLFDINDASADEAKISKRLSDLAKYGIQSEGGTQQDDGTVVYEISNLGIFLKIIAVHKTNGSQIEQIKYTHFVENNGEYYIEIREPLGSDTSIFDKNVTTQNYFFKIYMCEIGEIIKTGKLVASTLQSELDTVKDGQKRTQISSCDLYHVDITNAQNLSSQIGLAFTIANDQNTVYVISNYIIKDDDGQNVNSSKDISKERNTFYLYNGSYNTIKYTKNGEYWTSTGATYVEQTIYFEGSAIELFTGKIGSETYIDGLSASTSKLAKNISNIKYDKEAEDGTTTTVSDLTYTGKLNTDVFDYSSEYNIYYQPDSLNNVQVFYGEYGSPSISDNLNATEKHSKENMNVTLKYTGVNTENAYIASQVHYVYVNGLDLNENGELTGDETISFMSKDENNTAYWADGFALETGYGIANILAGSEDKTFVGSNFDIDNVSNLSFEAGELKGTTATPVTSLFTVDNFGNITLKKYFVPNSYYISIIVKCNYKIGTETHSIAIGTIYLAFVAVKNMTIASIGDNQYKVDITNYVGGQKVLPEQVKLEGCVTTKVDQESNKWYAIFEGSNPAQFAVRLMLTVGTSSSYVYFNEIYYIETPASITLYRMDNDTYAILGNNISIYDNQQKRIVNATEYLGNLQISIMEKDTNEDLIKTPANIVNSNAFVNKTYFEFDISNIERLKDSNKQYYISYQDTYCPVNIIIEELYLDSTSVTISNNNQIFVYDLQLSNGVDKTYLSDLTLKIDGIILTVDSNGYITFNGYSADKSMYILSATDESNNTYNMLIEITQESLV